MQLKWPHLRFFLRYRVQILMWAMVAEMLASPLADTHPLAGVLLGITVLLMVLVGIEQMATRRIVHRTVLPIAALWMIARVIEIFGNRRQVYADLSTILGLFFSCSILWAIFTHFRCQPRERRNAITEAFVSYLIIATSFGQLYWILNRFVDHAFNQVIPCTQHGTFLFFSMVTLTSVGYGGIIPINPYVRMVAAFESMAGIFFIAVVVARLVASYNQKARPRTYALSDAARVFADGRSLRNIVEEKV